ncbi:hypothetical protein KXV22_003983 [Aspergillus fumigatus]|uniref:Zn(2)-C6 fungal-type domain-containing protein n=1 Tax=Aspergillus fumigatus TaxID=746128 RepID=A0A9P8SU12_ASPFM|nr:hypothetical protein KXX06_005700 [Aspergillus fumigatus]KAH1583147.1 hypothetical protein KXX17_000026 [Aspergillus fumigatus]KAH1602398.1 hypothetical protein KXX34_001258 [Aspergillus fumigatus]KAH1641296.1 hypothetical protein KXX39_000893 [Aspergillus fumigatus]KAH1718373.1 hypothetical protein KXX40_002705 [Aspergillus fumigatus]
MEPDEQSPQLADTSGSRRKSRSDSSAKRVSRACLHCRQRKSKCDLDSCGSPGVPPCQRCIRDNRECVLGGSNRGGRRIRKNKMKNFTPGTEMPTRIEPLMDATSPSTTDSRPNASTSYSNPVVFVQPNPPATVAVSEDDEDTASIGSVPRNPSDAWQCLTGIAKRGADDLSSEPHTESARPGPNGFPPFSAFQNGAATDFPPTSGIRAYRLVQTRALDPGTVWQLVARYAENFHPYLPLVPRKYFNRNALDDFATNEKHLLTAVLTIASKDLVERPEIHEYCSKYMHELISGIAAGADCDVEAVEALLLLAEWEPQGLRPRIERVGRGEEDRAAWMHVGLALRSGYFLGLDRTSFRGDASGDTETEARRRLAWTCCYISDRLISVRIGRAFWSRGPGPMTGLVSQDFPSLQPVKSDEEDYAKIFQATLDLTQLYNNVHDVLYSGMRTSNQMMLMGDYVKYVDDFRLAILRWKSRWGSLSCSTPMRATMQLSYEYLRLYTNAFAFQAAISQSLVSKHKNNNQSQREHLRATFNNVASMQDARFIYESVDAAKAYLTILVDEVHPEKHLHFMPLRFYLYGIYAAVFLYKARSFGVMLNSEEMKVRELVSRTTEVLKRASAGPDDIGARYARLLELLWQSKPAPALSPTATHRSSDLLVQNTLNRLPEQSHQLNDVRGRLALITGASGGIGAACARQLAQKGVHLALTYSTNLEAMNMLVKELRSSQPAADGADALRISIHQVDVASADQIQTMFAQIDKEHGQRPDILVSNAGYGKRIPQVWDISLEEFDYTINVNLRASFILVKGVVDHMREQRWGRIVFMSSIAGYGGGINGCHYAASKGGMTGMMKNLATRLAEYNISVNDVAPAMIGDTGMIPSAQAIPEVAAGIPLGRLGTPEEVANVVSMLVTTGYMTGQSLLLAGGLK